MVWTLERTARPRKVNVEVAHQLYVILMIIFSTVMYYNSRGWVIIQLLSVRILIDEDRDLCWVKCIYFRTRKYMHQLAEFFVGMKHVEFVRQEACIMRMP